MAEANLARTPRLAALARRGAALAGFALAVLAVPVLATGCSYLLRASVAHWPGPKVPDALPLDALPHHAAVTLVVYVAMLAIASALAALAARAIGLGRLSAALALFLGVGLWSLGIDAVSWLLVYQVGALDALERAALTQSVYIAAAIAGLAGALLAREPAAPNRGAITLVVYATTVSAILDLLAVVLPHPRREDLLVGELTHGYLPPIAAILIVPVAALLLVTARGLSRRSGAAWRIAVLLLGALALLDLVHGLDVGDAAVTGLVLILLVARRNDFTASTDPEAYRPAVETVAVFFGGAYLFAFLALLASRTAVNLPVNLSSISVEALRCMIGRPPTTAARLRSGLRDWLPWAVVAIEAVGLVRATMTWTAPWSHRLRRDERQLARAAELVRRHGSDTLAPFALRADKDRFFFAGARSSSQAEGGSVLIAYRAVRGVAVVAGDPIGPDHLVEPAIAAFLEQVVHAKGWRVAILGASERYLDVYARCGLRALYHGDEALVNVEGYTLDRPAMRTARQAVNRVARKGYTSEVRYASEIRGQTWMALREVEAEWLGGRPKTGFVMQLDDLGRLRGTDALFVVGRDHDGAVAGFLHVAVCPASGSLSLSSMPRRRSAANGLNAFLIDAAVRWAREHGFTTLSLNFSPFAGLLGEDAELSGLRQIERKALLAVKHRLQLQLDNLLLFNRQFAPCFEPRFVVIERRADLPRALVAMMSAEGYFPFSSRIRGRHWVPDDEGAPVPPTTRAPAGDEGEDDPTRVPTGSGSKR